MANGAAGGKRQEENIDGARQMQVHAKKAQAILGCAGGLGQRFAMVVGRRIAGISHAGRGGGRIGKGCSMQGEKGEEQHGEDYSAEIEEIHALEFTVTGGPCQEE
jgi:hypothetical protein